MYWAGLLAATLPIGAPAGVHERVLQHLSRESSRNGVRERSSLVSSLRPDQAFFGDPMLTGADPASSWANPMAIGVTAAARDRLVGCGKARADAVGALMSICGVGPPKSLLKRSITASSSLEGHLSKYALETACVCDGFDTETNYWLNCRVRGTGVCEAHAPSTKSYRYARIAVSAADNHGFSGATEAEACTGAYRRAHYLAAVGCANGFHLETGSDTACVCTPEPKGFICHAEVSEICAPGTVDVNLETFHWTSAPSAPVGSAPTDAVLALSANAHDGLLTHAPRAAPPSAPPTTPAAPSPAPEPSAKPGAEITQTPHAEQGPSSPTSALNRINRLLVKTQPIAGQTFAIKGEGCDWQIQTTYPSIGKTFKTHIDLALDTSVTRLDRRGKRPSSSVTFEQGSERVSILCPSAGVCDSIAALATRARELCY